MRPNTGICVLFKDYNDGHNTPSQNIPFLRGYEVYVGTIRYSYLSGIFIILSYETRDTH